jgi:hypothetical protein
LDRWYTDANFRGDYAMGVYKDSLIYFFGGFDFNYFLDYSDVQIYDPLNDVWTSGTNVPANGYGWQAGITGNKIVLFGGSDANTGLIHATTYVGTINPNDPSDISWEQVEDMPAGPAFRPGGGASANTASGLVIFTGGDPDGNGINTLNYTFGYDVNSNSWKIGPNKITAVNNIRNLTCMEFKDSLYLVSVGGLDNTGSETSVNEWLNLGSADFGVGVQTTPTSNFSAEAYPNPFSKSTMISFTLEHASNVEISIVDVTGKELQMICSKNLPAGDQQVTWNASGFAAAIYFAKISVNDEVITKKLVKIK